MTNTEMHDDFFCFWWLLLLHVSFVMITIVLVFSRVLRDSTSHYSVHRSVGRSVSQSIPYKVVSKASKRFKGISKLLEYQRELVG